MLYPIQIYSPTVPEGAVGRFTLGCVQTDATTLLRQQCWELLRACWQWSANRCNNSQHCCVVPRSTKGLFTGYVRVGSGVQTDATTANKFGTCSASWEEYNP